MKQYSGFTLIELMVTVAIVAILLAVAIPSMRVYILNDRLTSQINTLVSHLSLARSEAVLRNQQVIVCISSDNATCTGDNWQDGWIIFVDANSDDKFNAGEEIVRVQQQLEGGNTLNSTLRSVIYDYRGFATDGGTFSLCDHRGGADMRSISISNTGRVRQGGGAACPESPNPA